MPPNFPSIFRRVQTIRNSAFLFALVLLLSGYWVLIQGSSLNYYWNNDDLHLVRNFSTEELTHAFSGTWDVDHIETPGFRPFTVLFNHLRYVAFGESPALQRLFLLGLMAVLLWLIGWIGLQLGLKRGVVALTLLIVVSTKAFSGDIIWIADGVHVFQNLLLAICTVCMFSFVRRQSIWAALLSLFVAWMAFWTREDSLIALLILPVLFVAFYSHINGIVSLKELLSAIKNKKFIGKGFLAYFLILYGLAIATLVYRIFAVPEAHLVPSLNLVIGLANQLRWSVWIVGSFLSKGTTSWGVQAGSILLELVTLLWGVSMGVCFSFLFFRSPTGFSTGRRRSVLCLVCMVLACLPGLNTPRSNLLFWPTVFFTFAFVLIVFEIWGEASSYNNTKVALNTKVGIKNYNALHLCLVLMCMLAVAGSMKRATIQRLDMHPLSINQISREYDWIYGIWAQKEPSIPADRQAFLIAKLDSLGITASDPSEQVIQDMYAEALKHGWFTLNDESKPFIPKAAYLAP